MKTIIMLGVTLISMIASHRLDAGPTESWSLSLSPALWKAALDQVSIDQRYQVVNPVSGKREDGVSTKLPEGFDVNKSATGTEFFMRGNVPERRSMCWTLPAGPQDLTALPFLLIQYRARGIARDYTPVQVIAGSGLDPDGKRVSFPLLDASELIQDGKEHTVVRRLSLKLRVDLFSLTLATFDSSASLTLKSAVFYSTLPDVINGFDFDAASSVVKSREDSFSCLDLRPLFNDRLEKSFDRLIQGKSAYMVDGARSFSQEQLVVQGIPFRVHSEGMNLLRASEDPTVNNQTVEFLGAKIPRWNFSPQGRDDKIEVAVNRKVSEAFLLLVSELPSTHTAYACPPRSYKIDDLEGFALELKYADGEDDLAFPYSLADGGFILQRMVGAYVVPADPTRLLKSLVLHNRHFGKSVNLAALTLNVSSNQLFAKIWRGPQSLLVPDLRKPRFLRPYVKRLGSEVILGNTFYEIAIDGREGFTIQRLLHRWSKETQIAISRTSGLEIVMGNQVLTGRDFKVDALTTDKDSATFILSCLSSKIPLKLEVGVKVDETEQVKTNLKMTNQGSDTISASVKFPYLQEIKIGTAEDTWIFFPQYRNVITNRKGFHRAVNDRGFTVQFFDNYNPQLGIGIAFLTHNLNRTSLEYATFKDERGVSSYIHYPGDLHQIAPGQTMSYPETALVFHKGDWHEAMKAYQQWLATWYRPVKSQDKEWFSRIFLIRTHIPTEKYSWMVNCTPGSYDPVAHRFRIDEIADADRKYNKALPDCYHIFNWFLFNRDKDWLNYGDYSSEAYESLGGLSKFKGAIQKLQEEYKIPVSLYLVPDRCSKSNEAGKKYGELCAARRPDGSPEADEETWYMCLGATEWQDYFAKTVQRVQKETGVKIIYIDVFARDHGWRCYAKDHGHKVPFCMDMPTFDLIKKIRELLPSEVPIWSEFPPEDVSSQFMDGYITYSFMDMGREAIFAKSRDLSEDAPLFCEPVSEIYRYVLPALRPIALPCGIEGEEANWGQLKQIFFNGEPMQDVTWRLHSDRGLALLNHSFAIKREYADCFSSKSPIPFVPTERSQLYANQFPGKRRTVWTIFNARNYTMRGPVLAVEHHQGDLYLDVWNKKTLVPKIEKGRAILSLKLDPQGLGCIAQINRGSWQQN